jgi:hypothetical protein
MFFSIAESDTRAMSGNYPNDRFRYRAGPLRLSGKSGPRHQTGGFFILVILPDGAPETSRNRRWKTVPPPCPAPPLISPDTLLYYKYMNTAALIPIAFLVAGSVAIILTVYMYR